MKYKYFPRSIIILFCCMIMFPAPRFVFAEDIVIITNKDVPSDNLTTDEIRKIFLGDVINWKNNDVIKVVLSGDEETHNAFLKKYIKRTPTQFKNVWRRNLFTGKGATSTKIDSIDDLIQYVSTSKGAIGYIPSNGNIQGNVKIIGTE